MKFPLTKALSVFTHDLFAVILSFALSVYLIAGFENLDILLFTKHALILTVISFAVLIKSRIYRGLWKYASINEAVMICLASSLSIPLFMTALFLLGDLEHYPLTVFTTEWFLFIALLSGSRLLYRFSRDQMVGKEWRNNNNVKPVLLLGVTNQAELFIREMNRVLGAPYKVVGLIDTDDHAHAGMLIHGIPVLNHLKQLDLVMEHFKKQNINIDRLILADLEMPAHQLASVLADTERLGLKLSKLPKITDLEHGKKTSDIQPISLEDLLGRPQNLLDRKGIKGLIQDKIVLVTGSGGSIGSELVRQICALKPSKIILLDHSEFLLYTIDLEIKNSFSDLKRVSLLADVRDYKRMHQIFSDYRPHLVFHAAALKHVPIVEDQPLEGIQTNVFGTKTLADLSHEFGVTAMVMISTDKAVNPTNIMGTTKRLAESYCQALDRFWAGKNLHKTRYITVRFGNVLGSNGSVVPLFQKQLETGGPLTVTHPDVQRYFMTIREAVELVLQAFGLGVNNNRDFGKIFVLDMGEPVKIVDLAKQMIRLAGLRPEKDVKIEFVGLRPGEKLFEELFHDSEELVPTALRGILLADPRFCDIAIVEKSLTALAEKCSEQDLEGALSILKHMVPEYSEPDHHKELLAVNE
jgi:FlaA1/EpsC-like NDP-sugar epimerase